MPTKKTDVSSELIERLQAKLKRLRSKLESSPLSKAGELALEIIELEQRIKREQLHALSGYRTPRRPVSGGAPGSNRRK